MTVREIDGSRVKIGPIEAFESEPDWHYAGGRHQVSVDPRRRMIGVVISARDVRRAAFYPARQQSECVSASRCTPLTALAPSRSDD